MSGRLVHVLTVADSLVFIDAVVARARDDGWDVTVITSPDERLTTFGRKLGVRTVGIEMPRKVTPLGDWRALDALHTCFARLKPDVVHAGTPKGGLLGTLAARAAGVPVRIYQMRGLAYVTAKGVLRGVLSTTERLSCAAATRVICQSHSLRAEAVSQGLVSADKSEVILGGSNGVDANRFAPMSGAALRAKLGIPGSAQVVGFVGRLVRDKGVPELVEAFSQLKGAPHLILAGPWEPRDPVSDDVRRLVEAHPRIHTPGFVADPREVYAASDFVVLPSHREGFPNVPLEAAAMERAVISTRIAGCIDAVSDGVTGTLVSVSDAAALAVAMQRYLDSPELAARHGREGRQRVTRDFSRARIAEATVERYRALTSI
ncbi:MAG: glycosyltransferase family 1 protein [Archangium gephyra]|uniref:Glycosyltransferase family 1 protein n=1 Tax=Archangium gephyra TaxID=48 RepID=A0A2W5VV11_9BACT|nr:MAG: glycosyltransferase family 1 protein [Archangium gephyra]